jgi:hypothetical protein
MFSISALDKFDSRDTVEPKPRKKRRAVMSEETPPGEQRPRPEEDALSAAAGSK